MEAYLFLDESGDHGLTKIDPNYPLFLLCGCLFSAEALEAFTARMDELKVKYWGTTSVILHSRDIRRQDGPFTILFDLDVKREFYDDLNRVMEEAEYTVICAAVHKEQHAKKYGPSARDPYDISLGFVIERLIYCLDKHPRWSGAHVVLEKRGDKEDIALAAHMNRIRDKGTYYVTSERIQAGILGCDFVAKKENSAGLQCADLCAYPLGRSIVLKGEPSKSAEIVRSKLYCVGPRKYGLKIFP